MEDPWSYFCCFKCKGGFGPVGDLSYNKPYECSLCIGLMCEKCFGSPGTGETICTGCSAQSRVLPPPLQAFVRDENGRIVYSPAYRQAVAKASESKKSLPSRKETDRLFID